MNTLERNEKIFYEYICEDKTLAQVSKKYNLTRESIRRIAAQECRKIKSQYTYNRYFEGKISRIVSQSTQDILDCIRDARAGIIPIEGLDLSVRTYSCLKNEKIESLNDLLFRSEFDLLRTPNFGRKSLNEVKEVCLAYGITIGKYKKDMGSLT